MGLAIASTHVVVATVTHIIIAMKVTCLLVLQMIELSIDSSGEIELTSKPKSYESKVATFGNIISSSEDDTKIAELRNTIESLKAQIKASAVSFLKFCAHYIR